MLAASEARASTGVSRIAVMVSEDSVAENAGESERLAKTMSSLGANRAKGMAVEISIICTGIEKLATMPQQFCVRLTIVKIEGRRYGGR